MFALCSASRPAPRAEARKPPVTPVAGPAAAAVPQTRRQGQRRTRATMALSISLLLRPRPRRGALAAGRRLFFGIPSEETEAATDRAARKKAAEDAWTGRGPGAEGDSAPTKEHAALRRMETAAQFRSFQEFLDAQKGTSASAAGAAGSAGAAAAASPRADARAGGREGGGRERPTSAVLAAIEEFSMKPRDVKEHLDRFVIGQTEAKKVLSVALCDHYNRAREHLRDPDAFLGAAVKPNVLLAGPSGSGKTHLVRTLAKHIGVPFAKADATKFSATGYVGGDVEDIVRGLATASGDVDAARFGIVYVDEVDKLCAGDSGSNPFGFPMSGGSGGVNTKDVQANLLKLMEDGEVSLGAQAGPRGLPFAPAGSRGSQALLSTKHVLFIFSGAFTALPQTVRRRRSAEARRAEGAPEAGGGPGDGGDGDDDAALLRSATTQDFVDYGFETEFIGRIPVRIGLHPLGREDLEAILTDVDDSVLAQLRRDFLGYGIDVVFEDGAVEAVAERAMAEGTGARGLVTVLEQALREFKFELPSTDVKELRVDARLIEDPGAALQRLLAAQRAS